MKTLSIIILFFVSSTLFAQVADNFDDSDLLINPPWTGQLNYFNTQNKELHSTNNITNSVFYISTPSITSVNAEWHIDAKLLFNTSSLNYVDLVVMSDSSDVTKLMNGYFVRLGGTNDEISLYKTKNGIEYKIIDGADNILNSSNNQWQIVLTRHLQGDFSLLRHSLSGGFIVEEGFVQDSDIVTSDYFGIRIKQSTASFIGKHFFDNLYIGKILKDTIAPVLDSLLTLNSRQLQCNFNEPCDSLRLTEIMNYHIIQGLINPLTAVVINSKTVQLNFQNPFTPNTYLSLNIQNMADSSGNMLINTSKPFYYSKSDTAGFHEILITEMMPDPNPVVGLPDKEYVEITNISGKFIQLNGCLIHDPTGSKKIPNQILPPDSILVLTNIPSLNNASDRIWLTNQKGEIIHLVSYTDNWYKDNAKKNGGWSLEMINENNLCMGSNNWHASINSKGGTPGFVNSVKGNEPPDTKAPIIISSIPVNDSTIRLLFNEEIDSINSVNSKLTLIGSGGILKCQKMSADYTSSDWLINFKPNSDSLYNFVYTGIKDCSGNEITKHFFTIQWPSLSKKNDLVFNELLFNPKTEGVDFIEIYNNTQKVFDLSKLFIAVLDETKQYKSIEKLSSEPLFILPHQYLLMSEDSANICQNYHCGNTSTLKLDFSKMPSMPDDAGNLLLINLTGKIIDSLTYYEDWHFPLLSDKEGVSLERISFSIPARTKDNWHSAASVAGFATPGYLNSQTSADQKNNTFFSLQNKTISPDEDGFEDVLILNYKLPNQDYTTTITIYDTEGRLIKQWINNETLGLEGFIAWNGTDYNTQKASIGMYILDINSTHIDGSKINEKMSFTVAGRF